MTPLQSAVEAQGRAIGVVQFHHPELAEQMLTPEALQAMLEAVPKVWTAETIGEAPNGLYQGALGGEWLEGYETKEWWVNRLTRKIAPWPNGTLFFGPIPVPPNPPKAS